MSVMSGLFCCNAVARQLELSRMAGSVYLSYYSCRLSSKWNRCLTAVSLQPKVRKLNGIGFSLNGAINVDWHVPISGQACSSPSPISFFNFPLFFGGDLQYSAPKQLPFLNQCGHSMIGVHFLHFKNKKENNYAGSGN